MTSRLGTRLKSSSEQPDIDFTRDILLLRPGMVELLGSTVLPCLGGVPTDKSYTHSSGVSIILVWVGYPQTPCYGMALILNFECFSPT